MNFREVKGTIGMRIHSQEIMKLMSDFLKSGIEVAEVTDWESCYASVGSAYISFRKMALRFYASEIRVSKANGKLFIARVEA